MKGIRILLFFSLTLGIFTEVMASHPRLLFNRTKIELLKQKSQTDAGKAIILQLRKRLNTSPDPLWVSSYAAGHALLFLLEGDSLDWQLSQYYTLLTIHDSIPFISSREENQDEPVFPLWNSDYKAIYRTPNLVGMALAYDLAYHHWPANFRKLIASEISDKAIQLIKGGGEGYNNSPWSNWQGITKGGAGFAALSVLNDPGSADSLSHYLNLAQEKLKIHLDYLGDKGWTPEGFDYLRYELNTGVLPFLQAFEHIYHKPFYDISKTGMFLPFYVMQSIVRDNQLFVPMYGLGGNEWNVNRWRSGDWVMGMGITPDKYLPAVLWTFDQAFGLAGDRTFDIYKPHDAIFALLNYPLDIKPENPEKILPKVWIDQKGGYFVCRNHWQDAEDMVITITSNQLAKPASHSHMEAGSFRIFGLAANWATRPVKNKSLLEQKFENRVYVEEASSWLGAGVEYLQAMDDGSLSLTLDMDSAYFAGERLKESYSLGIKFSRFFVVDFSKKSGAEAVIIVKDHFETALDKTWIMHTDLQDVDLQDHGFTIKKGKARLTGHFLKPRQPVFDFFQANSEIQVRGKNEFLVVLTLSKMKNLKPELVRDGKIQKIQLGKARYVIKNNSIILP